MPLKTSDHIIFFPYDPIRKTIFLSNRPVEGVIVDVLPAHYRINLYGFASCMVTRANPTLMCRRTESGAPIS